MSLASPVNIICNDMPNCEAYKMTPIRHILVPFNDASHATKAFGTALTLAKNFGARISLAAVVQDEIKNSWVSGTPGREKGMSERSSSRLSKKMQFLEMEAQKFNVRVDSVVISSKNVAETVLSLIREYKIDFVVMGSRGKGMEKEMMLGRVSTHVALNALCPVLLVK